MAPHPLPRSEARDLAKIEAEAANWLVRRGDVARAAAEEDAFYAWLEADPRHGEIYDELARTLEDVGQLKGLASLPQTRHPLWSRSRVPAIAVAAAALIAIVLIAPRIMGLQSQTFETAVAETRLVRLADGSTITLGGDSEISVRLGENDRRVVLASGEAFFEVAPDASRPFYVEAGGTLVRVVGTKFDVHRGVDGVRVAVQEGRVEVRDSRALTLTSPAVRVLTAGQRTQVTDRPTYLAIAAAPLPVEPVTVAPPGAWREGRLAYDDARLADVVADINRYYAPGVRLAGMNTEDVRVTAAFRTDQIPAFLDALAETLPVAVERAPDGAYAVETEAGPN